MFEAILFDMDGLFIDSEPDWHAAETEMMRGYGYDWQPADQLQCLGGPLARVTEYMSSCLNGSVKPETLAKVIIDEMQNRLSSTAAYMPGAIEFSKLVWQAQIPQALVSASPRTLVDAVISGLTHNYFKETVEFVKSSRKCIKAEDTHIHNIVDELIALQYKTIYKLTYNK